MRILYISYIDLGDLESGSKVRPVKILEALENTGHEIVVLTGNQTGKDRKKSIQETERSIQENKPDICYVESPTHPIFRSYDRKFIRKLHQMGIPIGFFLRDFRGMFKKDFPRRTNSLEGFLKDFYWDCLWPKTFKTLNYCDIVYLPSEKCKGLFNYHDMRALPPAGDNHLTEKINYSHTCIYVGGWGGSYDGCFLLDAFEKLYKEDHTYHLILVCRKKEWDSFSHPCKNASWLEVHHVSGNELTPLYRRSSLGLFIGKKDYEYMKYCIPVKTYEYMGYGLPIVAANAESLSVIIENEKTGIATEADIDKFNDAIKTILNDRALYEDYVNNTKESLLKKNLWKYRVEQIISDLSSK